MPQLEATQTRELFMRAEVTDDGQLVRGVGVPYGETITVWGQRERLERGAVDAEGALLFYRHSEPIGIVVEHSDDDAGWHPTGRFSNTRAAQDARELARDGALPGMSIGFEPIKWRMEHEPEGDVIVYEQVRVREVSLVPFPAYPSATVTEVREDRTPKEPIMPATEEREDDLADLREDVADVRRSLAVILDRGDNDAAPAVDQRSGGEWLRALAARDEDTIREYEALVERAYTGGTSADGLLTPQWVGDTIRLVERPNALGSVFSTGTLPSKGLTLEYGELDTNTIDVTEQLLEGDDLTKGKLTVRKKNAPIKTYGGIVELTRQEIERTTNVSMLDLHLRGLGMKAAARKAAVLNALYEATYATQAGVGGSYVVVADQTKYVDWVSGIVDAADKFEQLGLELEALVVDKTVFKTLAGLQAADGRPLMIVYGTGENVVGQVNVRTISGNLVGVRVVYNPRHTTAHAAFVNAQAIRQYNGSITELTDENIVNLSKQFGLYYYAANAAEIPGAIMPVVATIPA
ncbi:HK97 family phage prohead protease [Microbacterium sp. KNMS]